MARSSSAKPPNGTNTNSTRRTSNLTPSQLARKRANDREAQRALRARNRDYVKTLERELEGLKSRFRTLEELLRRKMALEDELLRLKEEIDLSVTSLTSSTREAVYDDNPNTSTGAIRSPRASPSPPEDYGSLPDCSQQYVPLPNNCESWANTVPVPSNVSSPSSSANTDDYGAGYIPTSVPASMLPSNNTSTSSISAVGTHKDIKMQYKDVDHPGMSTPRRERELRKIEMDMWIANAVDFADASFRLANQSMQGVPNPYMQSQQQQFQYQQHLEHQQDQHQQQQQHQQPAWNMYPAVYYLQAQSSVH
ncbi:hypothetical protein EDB81DRAFT_894332 [Dactylonectria macrodidyma]|uniref:BZIP domain-containing protein n=1 Tax=Dactylonectria macrodidyma TaxID=307937 RepID=A0A9P9D2N8_9HYPO|nr:hypothetical protein EDB81DRAFT_894332 [Dactylonectria macrodidyma]